MSNGAEASTVDSTNNEIWATGRRKTAIARVKLSSGKGDISINNRTVDNYLGGYGRHKQDLKSILKYIPQSDKFDIFVNVTGGGMTGQVGAIKLGIARALSVLDPSLRPKLKQEGFLMRDPRMVERKKSGQPKARKKFQWTKR